MIVFIKVFAWSDRQLGRRSWKLFMAFLTFLSKGILLKSWGFKDPKFKCWVMMWADIPFDVVYVLKILITKPNEVWKYLCLKNVIHFMYPFYFHIRKCIFYKYTFNFNQSFYETTSMSEFVKINCNFN